MQSGTPSVTQPPGESQPAAPPPDKRQVHWLSVLQFILSGLATFFLWTFALGAGLMGVFQIFSDITSAVGLLTAATAFGFLGLLLAPSAALALMDMLGRPLPVKLPRIAALRPTILIFALLPLLLLGYVVTRETGALTLILPLIQPLAIGLPVLWLLYLGIRELPLGSAQRAFGIFGSGLVLAPLLIIVIEIAALIGMLVIVALVVSNQPDLIAQLSRLAEQGSLPQMDPDQAIELLAPYITHPGVILVILVFAAALVPLIEEALKPIGVWFLVGSNPSPAAGFAAGALSGAGYALFESLMLGGAGDQWALVVTARIGTAVIHILTTALTGWALAVAWRHRRYLRLALVYLLVVAIHAAWNGLTMVSSVSGLYELPGAQPAPGWVTLIAPAAPWFLGGMALIGLVALPLLNRRLQRQEKAEDYTELESIPVE